MNTTYNAPGVNTLGERAMLVSLSVSVWSARKHDSRISDKVADDHGADRSMGRYAKHLIPRERLSEVNAANTALRDHHNANTLAWSDDGTRILPAANFFAYQHHQQGLETRFARAVADFVKGYPAYVEDAAKSLKGLFNPRDYPAPDRIAGKFGVRRDFLPVAQPDDFRVRIGDAEVSRIRAEIEARNDELVMTARRELWQRVQEVTAKLAARLDAYHSPSPDGVRAHQFRDSLVDNLRGLLDLMPRLNLTDDRELERVRRFLAENVACHEADTLRESPVLSAKVIDSATEILSKMEGYC